MLKKAIGLGGVFLIFIIVTFGLIILFSSEEEAGQPLKPTPIQPTLGPVSAAQFTKLAEIEAPEDLIDIEVSPDQSRVYIPSYDESLIYEIDAALDKLVRKIPVTFPNALQITPDGKKAYVAQGDHQVSLLNLSSQQVEKIVPAGDTPIDLLLLPEKQLLFVLNSFSNNVSVFDAPELRLITIIPVGRLPKALAISRNQVFLYVTNYDQASISVISTTSLSVIAEISINGRPSQMLTHPQEDLLFVSDNYTNQVILINTKTNQVAKKITVDEFPDGMTINPSTQRLYVASFFKNTISVIDLASLELITTIATAGRFTVSSGFNLIKYLPAGEKFYLTNTINGTVLVYRE